MSRPRQGDRSFQLGAGNLFGGLNKARIQAQIAREQIRQRERESARGYNLGLAGLFSNVGLQGGRQDLANRQFLTGADFANRQLGQQELQAHRQFGLGAGGLFGQLELGGGQQALGSQRLGLQAQQDAQRYALANRDFSQRQVEAGRQFLLPSTNIQGQYANQVSPFNIFGIGGTTGLGQGQFQQQFAANQFSPSPYLFGAQNLPFGQFALNNQNAYNQANQLQFAAENDLFAGLSAGGGQLAGQGAGQGGGSILGKIFNFFNPFG